jgi:asparagine synthase (glutamine-hydrolysing)
MCGFYFRYDFQTEAIIEDADRINLRRIAHRGPDSTALINYKKSIIGFNRLAIRDLAGGTQPYIGQITEFISCINGELYNEDFIRNRLLSKHPNKKIPTGDMQLMAEYISAFGIDSLRDVDGMFAGILFIPSSNLLFLFRDKVGEKPLYFRLSDREIVVSSETRSLQKPESQFNCADTKSILKGYWGGTETCYLGISKVPAATLATVNLLDGAISLNKYWSWPVHTKKVSRPAREFELDQISKSLVRSVRNQMISDVPMALFLSGGLDSSVVLGIVKNHLNLEIDSITLDFEETRFSEGLMAAKTAKALGSNHTNLKLSSRDVSTLIPLVLDAMEIPIFDPACIGVFALSKYANEHGFKVVLTGDGGDELFRGYKIFEHVKYLSMATRMPWLSKNMSELIRITRIGQGKYLGVNSFARKLIDVLNSPDYLIPEIALSPFAGSPILNLVKRIDLIESRNFSTSSELELEFESYYREKILPELYLVKSDRMSMIHSVELRNPLLDGEILRALENFYQIGCKIPNKREIFSSLLGRDFPQEVMRGKKRGFGIPIINALSLMSEPEWNLDGMGITNDVASQMWKSVLKGDYSQTQAIWGLMVLNHFMRKEISLP